MYVSIIDYIQPTFVYLSYSKTSNESMTRLLWSGQHLRSPSRQVAAMDHRQLITGDNMPEISQSWIELVPDFSIFGGPWVLLEEYFACHL